MLADLEYSLTAYSAHRMRKFQAAPQLIQEIDKIPPPAPKCPRGKLRLHISTVPKVLPASAMAGVAAAAAARGVALTRMPIVIRTGLNSIPGSTGGGMASPQQPRLAAPAPQLSSTTSAVSGAVTRPAGQANIPTVPSQLSSAVTTGVSAKDALTDKVHPVGPIGAQPIHSAPSNPTESTGNANCARFFVFSLLCLPSSRD